MNINLLKTGRIKESAYERKIRLEKEFNRVIEQIKNPKSRVIGYKGRITKKKIKRFIEEFGEENVVFVPDENNIRMIVVKKEVA